MIKNSKRLQTDRKQTDGKPRISGNQKSLFELSVIDESTSFVRQNTVFCCGCSESKVLHAANVPSQNI